MLADRESAYRQWNLPLDEALRQEGAHGYRIVFEEGVAGAARFSGGAGRHGSVES
jgi:enoyl-CoA hydratase